MSLIAIIIWLLGQGFVIEQAVQVFKRVSFVAANPKLAAAVLNVIAAFVLQYVGWGLGQALSTFLLAVAAALTSTLLSIGFYEGSKSAKRLVGAGGGKPA